ncbi:MAG: hypothetical protein ABIR47_12695 [Candidatus Kapaibacterium sp.]
MWYISFQGESDGEVNNILIYHDSGVEHSQPNLLPTGGANPALQELRGFTIVGDLLYVVNAYKRLSQLLLYRANGDGTYLFESIFASAATINSILHPFDCTFDPSGNCYLSSQDTNVVTRLQDSGAALPVAPYLLGNYNPSGNFLAGTFVASTVGGLPGVHPPAPPDVPAPQGLQVAYTDGTDTRVANSVRGVAYYADHLFVADEPGNAVKIYDGTTGQLACTIAGSNLSAPVHLLFNGSMLYIGSSGNDSVLSCDLSSGVPAGTVAPVTFIDGGVKHISGMAFDGDGNFYAAERKAKKIKKFSASGASLGDFITGLPDEPEFIMYVPKAGS